MVGHRWRQRRLEIPDIDPPVQCAASDVALGIEVEVTRPGGRIGRYCQAVFALVVCREGGCGDCPASHGDGHIRQAALAFVDDAILVGVRPHSPLKGSPLEYPKVLAAEGFKPSHRNGKRTRGDQGISRLRLGDYLVSPGK